MTLLILMATYNGEQFLADQVGSIESQAYEDWHLLVRDDDSRDGTCELLKSHASRDPRIELVKCSAGRLGVQRNFSKLIGEAARRGAAYIALSDQDDIWRSDKLARQMDAMRSLEDRYGRNTPCLVHSDLEVSDDRMACIHPSFVQYQGIGRPQRPPALTCLLQNHVVGCTILANKALLRIAAPVPDGIHMHDWWLNLCGRFGGATRFIEAPLVKYRQHATNRVGARGSLGLIARPERWMSWTRKMACLYRHAFYQAGRLRDRLPATPPARHPDLSLPREHSYLNAFLALRAQPRPARLAFMLRRRVQAQHPALTLLLYLQSLMLSVEGYEERPEYRDGCRER